MKPEEAEAARHFAVSVAAAVVDEQRGRWRPPKVKDGAGRPIRIQQHEALTRAHIDFFRSSGATRDEVADYVTRHCGFTEDQVAKLDSDLDSYGTWTGG